MLTRARMRPVALKRPLERRGGNAFETDYATVEADVQPMNGTAAAQMYGLRPDEMRLMLFAPGTDVQRDMGACVDVEAAADPDYRVLYVAWWARHGVAHLKYIPEAERGADE